MARRKKPTRKYKPKNEFRYNNSRSGRGHPNYIFGETKTKYKSLGLTTHPNEEYSYIKLSSNPNKSDKRSSFVEVKAKTASKRYYSEPLDDFKFSKSDMAIIRLLIKRYKKSTNRHKKK